MNSNDKMLLEAFSRHPGGIGEPLSEAERKIIRDGRQNHSENCEPYDCEKLIKAGEDFMDRHPISWLRRNSVAR